MLFPAPINPRSTICAGVVTESGDVIFHRIIRRMTRVRISVVVMQFRGVCLLPILVGPVLRPALYEFSPDRRTGVFDRQQEFSLFGDVLQIPYQGSTILTSPQMGGALKINTRFEELRQLLLKFVTSHFFSVNAVLSVTEPPPSVALIVASHEVSFLLYEVATCYCQ